MDGNTQIALNGGVGLHVLSNGNRLTDVDSDSNGLHGMYFDGRIPGDWTPSHSYVVPTLIKPRLANPGGFYFLSVNVNGTSSASPPAWSQAIDSLVPDGSVQWVSLGNLRGLEPLGAMSVNLIKGGLVDDNGMTEPDGFVSDNVRIEGTLAGDYTAKWNQIDGTHIGQGKNTQHSAAGVRILNSSQSAITGMTWIGGAWGDMKSDDFGGIVIDHSLAILVTAYTSELSSRNPVQVLHSSFTTVQGFTATDTGVSSSDLSDTYCVFIDDASDHTTLSNISCLSQNGFGRGVYNAAQGTTLDNYVNSTAAVPPDHLGTIASFTDSLGNGSFHSLQAPTATVNQLQASDLAVAGGGTFNSLASTTATIGSVKASSLTVQGDGTFNSLESSTATISDLHVSNLLTTPSWTQFTSGQVIGSGRCEYLRFSIPGVTPKSRPLWNIEGSVGNGWAYLSIQPHAQDDAVVIAICNSSAKTVWPSRAAIDISVIN